MYPLFALFLSIAAAALLWYFIARRRGGAQAPPRAEDPPAEPGPLAIGIKAYMQGEHERAEPILRYHAEAGQLKAQQLMARMYYAGHGVPRDMEQYRYWLERAADNGDRSAKARLKARRRD